MQTTPLRHEAKTAMTKYDKRSFATRNKGGDSHKDPMNEKTLSWPVEWDPNELEVQRDGEHVQVFGQLGEDGRPSAEQLEAMARVKPSTPAEQDFQEATRVMLAGDYGQAKEMFQDIFTIWPEQRAAALLSMGACAFWMRRYDEAIALYRRAGEAGAPADMVAANIEEAEEAKGRA